MRFQNYLLIEGVYDPGIFKAVFLAGGPGSGKSFVASQTTKGVGGLKVVNSDTLFEILGKQQGLDLKNFPKSQAPTRDKIRSHAKDLTNKQLVRFINGRLGLVIDGTGRQYDKIKKQYDTLKLLGYDSYMIFVNTSLEVALERNAKRARSVPENLVIDAWKGVQKNIGKFQSLFGSKNFKVIDNNEYVDDKSIFSSSWKDIMKFTRFPIENPIAKEWVKSELESRKAGKKAKQKEVGNLI